MESDLIIRLWAFRYDPDPKPYEDWATIRFILSANQKDAYETRDKLNKRSKGSWTIRSVENDKLFGPGDALNYLKKL